MRYPEGHKAAVRASIVAAAARALRRDGISGVSIPALMKQLDLTHGGFYGHFANRDELVVEAILTAANETADNVLSEKAGSLNDTLAMYLSKEHVAHPEVGCVLAALGPEARHHSEPIKKAFAHVAEGFLALLDRKVDRRGQKHEPSDAALARASQMIGAVVLARILDDPKLVDRLLETAKRA